MIFFIWIAFLCCISQIYSMEQQNATTDMTDQPGIQEAKETKECDQKERDYSQSHPFNTMTEGMLAGHIRGGKEDSEPAQTIYEVITSDSKKFFLPHEEIAWCKVLRDMVHDGDAGSEPEASLSLPDVTAQEFKLFYACLSKGLKSMKNEAVHNTSLSVDPQKAERLLLRHLRGKIDYDQMEAITLLRVADNLGCEAVLQAGIDIYAKKFLENKDNPTWHQNHSQVPAEIDVLISAKILKASSVSYKTKQGSLLAALAYMPQAVFHGAPITPAHFSPCSNYLLGYNQEARHIVGVNPARCVMNMDVWDGTVQFSEDDSLLLRYKSSSWEVEVYDLHSKTKINSFRLQNHNKDITALPLSHNNLLLPIRCKEGVTIYNIRTGKVFAALKGIKAFHFIPHSSHAVYVEPQNPQQLVIWNSDSKKTCATIPFSHDIRDLEVSPHGSVIYTKGRQHCTVLQFDAKQIDAKSESEYTFERFEHTIDFPAPYTLLWSQNEKYCAFLNGNRRARDIIPLINIAEKKLHIMPVDSNFINACAAFFSGKSNRLILYNKRGEAEVYSPPKGNFVRKIMFATCDEDDLPICSLKGRYVTTTSLNNPTRRGELVLHGPVPNEKKLQKKLNRLTCKQIFLLQDIIEGKRTLLRYKIPGSVEYTFYDKQYSDFHPALKKSLLPYTKDVLTPPHSGTVPRRSLLPFQHNI